MATQQQLSEIFSQYFRAGGRFHTITEARHKASDVLGYSPEAGTPEAKQVEESIELGLVRVARDLVASTDDPILAYEKCLDLYDRQPGLNTRTSTSVLQQAYSTPIPIAFLAGKLAGIDSSTSVYEPTAGNGALLILADPKKVMANELNPDRAAALRSCGYHVTQKDATVFLPNVPPVDRVICNPPFNSLKDELGQSQMFRQGKLYTSQIDHAIALKALDLLKPDGKAVLILGGKLGDEASRADRYNSQLTRGFYRWLYYDAGYKVTDHFSIDGSLYRKQGASFPIDVVLIEGKGETELKLPAVSVPRQYSSFESLKAVIYATIQRNSHISPNPRTTIQLIPAGDALDTGTNQRTSRRNGDVVDNGAGTAAVESDRESRGVPVSANEAIGVADRRSDRGLASRVRTSGREGRGSANARGNISLPANVPESSVAPLQSSTDGRALGDGLQRTSEDESASRGAGTGVSGNATEQSERPGKEPETATGYESNGLADLDENRSEPRTQRLETNGETALEEGALDNQVPYTPRSKAFSLGTLSPASALSGLQKVFDKIEARTGMTVDEYVQKRLGEPTQESLFNHYAAEQIDSLALCIYNYEYERKATLIGHDTGIGKTRIVCGLARYAKEQGLIPTIVTADPVLYSDILARDAVDTGNSFHPLLTNNGMRMSLRTPDGEEMGELRTPANHVEKIREYAAKGNIGNHDSVFTTYGQLTGAVSLDRRRLLEAIAPNSFLILDESHKAGGASGEQRPKTKAEKARAQQEDYIGSCTEFFQKLVNRVPGFVASSATAIKDPIVAARLFYETTDFKYAAPSQEEFKEHLKAGGVPLQQMMFAKWAESGGCIRCEKSYEGIEFGIRKVPVSLSSAENNAKILNLIWQFDKLKREAVDDINSRLAEAGEKAQENEPSLGEAGATSTIFTSVLHNLNAVTSLALKVDATATEVIADIKAGRKPIVMLFNTMESLTEDFINTHNEVADAHNAEFPDSPMQRIKVGDTVNLDVGELFMRYLEKSRTIKITEPYLEELTGKQKVRTHRLSDEELGETATKAFDRAKAAIEASDWSKIPVSPIDYFKQRVEDAGCSIGEITGRTHILKYESASDIETGVLTYRTREHGTAQKKRVMEGFQNGELDAVITNSTTGYSLHAARTVADQRQRVMYIIQPHLDVNQVEQSIGRSHRTGQVDPAIHQPDGIDERGKPVWGRFAGAFGLPVFHLVVGEDLPTEERAVAVLMKKMAHLKANTTGNRRSSFGLVDMPDFINQYGNEVTEKLMIDNPELHAALDEPLMLSEDKDEYKSGANPKAIQKVTGRASMLVSDEPPTEENPYPSLARQAWLYDTLASDYQELLAQKNALGENELEAQKLDLRAKPISRLVLNPGQPEIDSPFAAPAYLVEVMAKTGRKPNTMLQVVNAVRRELEFEPISDLADHDDYERSDVRTRGRDRAVETIDKLTESTQVFLEEYKHKESLKIAASQGKIAKCQEKLDVQIAIKEELTQELNSLVIGDETASQSNQFKAKLAQQEPKIEKLTQQLNQAQLSLNKKEYNLNKGCRLIEKSLETVRDILKRFPPGQGVELADKEGNRLYGVVEAVEQKDRAGTLPANPSNWKLRLLVADGSRTLAIKFDKIGNGLYINPIETAPSFLNPKNEVSVYELFDERQTQTEEKRYLVSGQVMGTTLKGKFAQVTDYQGQVHPVYLLPRAFNPEKDLDKKPIPFANPEQIKAFLWSGTGRAGTVTSASEKLKIMVSLRDDSRGLMLEAPKAKALGGKYYTDPGLLALTGEFISKGDTMKVYVPSDKVDLVLSYITQNTDWKLGAYDHKNVARKILGLEKQEWTPTDTINPEHVYKNEADIRLNAINVTKRTDAQNEGEHGTATPEKPLESKTVGKADTHEQKLTEPLAKQLQAETSIPQIAPPASQQRGRAEKNVAKLLHEAGLSQEILKGEDFHLRVKNDPYIPLVIEKHDEPYGKEGRLLPVIYLTHYLQQNGDTFIDSEMAFWVALHGELKLRETAVQNPFTGGESRSCDTSFAATFSRNLHSQGFVEATKLAWQEVKQVETRSTPISQEQPTPVGCDSEKPLTVQSELSSESADNGRVPLPQQESEIDTANAKQLTLKLFDTEFLTDKAPKEKSKRQERRSPSLQLQEKPVQLTLDLFGTNTKNTNDRLSTSATLIDAAKSHTESSDTTKPAVVQPVSPPSPSKTTGSAPDVASNEDNLNNLRWWYRASQLLGKSSQYLKDIADVVQNYKQGKPISPSSVAAMQRDVTQIMDVWEKAATALGKSQSYQNRIRELKGEWLAGKQLSTKPLDFMEHDIQQQRRQSQGRQL